MWIMREISKCGWKITRSSWSHVFLLPQNSAIREDLAVFHGCVEKLSEKAYFIKRNHLIILKSFVRDWYCHIHILSYQHSAMDVTEVLSRGENQGISSSFCACFSKAVPYRNFCSTVWVKVADLINKKNNRKKIKINVSISAVSKDEGEVFVHQCTEMPRGKCRHPGLLSRERCELSDPVSQQVMWRSLGMNPSQQGSEPWMIGRTDGKEASTWEPKSGQCVWGIIVAWMRVLGAKVVIKL